MTAAKITTNRDLTFQANINEGRFGWLRLTPAYSLHLVQDRVSKLPQGSTIIEPFSGSGTTALAAMKLGMNVYARDINPFLVWFANAKTASYEIDICENAEYQGNRLIEAANKNRDACDLWEPPIYKIDRWWSKPKLDALKALKAGIDESEEALKDLLNVAFCRTLIAASNAAFNHQSMSFKYDDETLDLDLQEELYESVLVQYRKDIEFVCESAREAPEGTCTIVNDDARKPFSTSINADYLITSPPYANRMSYIRELRPYMYWMRFLETAEDASELDWETIGGTWGKASTLIKYWKPADSEITPIEEEIVPIVEKILSGKSGEVLAPYVHKYFSDMWQHFKAVIPAMKQGSELCYIVGNSTFSGNEVPTQQWYAEMMSTAGLNDVQIEIIRKRNSNKKLFEYAVTGKK